MELVKRLLPKEASRRKIISSINRDKYLNFVNKHYMKGYCLSEKAKKVLLEENRTKFG